MSFEGNAEEKKARFFLANLGIDYDAITKEQFVTVIEVLMLSKHMKSPISQRGKAKIYKKEKVERQFIVDNGLSDYYDKDIPIFCSKMQVVCTMQESISKEALIKSGFTKIS